MNKSLAFKDTCLIQMWLKNTKLEVEESETKKWKGQVYRKKEKGNRENKKERNEQKYCDLKNSFQGR